MQALIFEHFGPPEVLQLRTLPDPELRPGSVLVRMGAAGLNFADIYRRRGDYMLPGPSPHVLGYEGAGVIEAVAEDVSGFRVGDRVGFADAPYANAELACVESDKAILLPESVSCDQVAALLLQGLTAQYLCEDCFAVGAGDRVVVHAAAGGVGRLLVQMCKAKGGHVHAVVSTPAKAAVALQAGADSVSVGAACWVPEVLQANPTGAHVVFDSIGTTLQDSLSVLRPRGRVVLFGFAGGEPSRLEMRPLLHKSLGVIGADLWDYLDSAAQRQSRARRLFESLAKGEITMPTIETFPLSQGAAAHARLESREVTGKVLLRITEGIG